jgi:hypothetical protein
VSITIPEEDPIEIGRPGSRRRLRAVVPVADRPYGKREGRIEDPFGHLWIVSQILDPAG